ncbi:hypothetical protein AB0F11_24880 [Streptomyces sp. NPDC032472]|uniref:hypothetical protein n=1 Tax=Streptomyces sp. NPDC032472 TaxID=3155018 RepID=UPI0033D91E19
MSLPADADVEHISAPPPKNELPRICQRPTITVRPGDLGMIDKFRQDRYYLHPSWQDVYRLQRANIEGLNGRAETHGINISDPSKRLAHGRVAQAILLALMICSVNLAILHSWHQTTGTLSVLTGVGTDSLPTTTRTAAPFRPASAAKNTDDPNEHLRTGITSRERSCLQTAGSVASTRTTPRNPLHPVPGQPSNRDGQSDTVSNTAHKRRDPAQPLG